MNTSGRKYLAVAIVLLFSTALPALVCEKWKNREETEPTILLYHTQTGEKEELRFFDYVSGCLAAYLESEEEYPEQAAQALSIALQGKLLCLKGQCEHAEEGADYCDDGSHGSPYLSYQNLVDNFGIRGEEIFEKAKQIVQVTYGSVLTYEGSLALTLTHQSSAYLTESAENIGGTPIPYLSSVISYETVEPQNFFFSDQEVRAVLQAFCKSDKTPEILSRNSSGRVSQVQVGDYILEGREFATLFNLPSTDFEIEAVEDGFQFTVYGIGSGLGMSRDGAAVLANSGYDALSILLTYFPNCTLTQIRLRSYL